MTKRAVWEQAKRDEGLANLLRALGERGMLGLGARIRVKPTDGEAVEWRNEG